MLNTHYIRIEGDDLTRKLRLAAFPQEFVGYNQICGLDLLPRKSRERLAFPRFLEQEHNQSLTASVAGVWRVNRGRGVNSGRGKLFQFCL